MRTARLELGGEEATKQRTRDARVGVGLDALLLKFGLMTSIPWLEIIQATGIMATFSLFIDLAMKLIFGN